MIFTNYDEIFESNKERNLYYKIFAGFFFNELLPGYEQRKKDFFDLLIDHLYSDQHFAKTVDLDKPLLEILKELSEDNLHVSFDFHPKQVITNYTDQGEVSDIIIWGDKYFISIEVKYLTDWTFKKDIGEVQNRIEYLGNKLNKKGIQVLLVKERKWLNNIAKLNQPGANLMKLKNNKHKLRIPLLVITWNQILKLIEEPKVKKYLLNQLDRK